MARRTPGLSPLFRLPLAALVAAGCAGSSRSVGEPSVPGPAPGTGGARGASPADGATAGGGAGGRGGAGGEPVAPPDARGEAVDVPDAAPPTPPVAVASWPQAGGPDGTFRIDVADAPTRWSVAANQNVLWRAPLPSEGQGGIAVWGDTLFLSTFPPFSGSKNGVDVLGHAIDRATGKIRWSVTLHGNGKPSPMAYSYSDATSWTPVTDGKLVWFFDAAGDMGCWDFAGKQLWRRSFPGQPDHFPFNRQHEPILFGDTIIILSPLGQGDPPPKAGQQEWNYLHGIDKMTGQTRWVAEDASTFYNTAVMGRLADGTPAVLHGRGGPHDVPETPVGLTMTSLAPGREGKTIWRYDGKGTALYTMTWDSKYAYWFTVSPDETQVVLDASTGKVVRQQSLYKTADVRMWDGARYVLQAGVNIHNLADPTYGGSGMHVMPNWHTNIAVGGYHYFLTSTNNNRTGGAGAHSGPPHCVGRVNNETGKVEYLEVPVGVQRAPGMPERLVYGKSLTTTAADGQGHDLAADGRSHTDGWEIPAFFASPIALGNKVYFGTTLGITYVVDASAAVLDERALLGIGDIGPLGQTWSLAGPSYSDGVLYHHSSKEVVAIRVNP